MFGMGFFVLIYRIIPQGWHGRFFMLMGLYIILGIFEMLGVASIMPFVALLSDPTAIAKSSIGRVLGSVSKVPVDQLPVHYVGLVVLFLFIIGNLLGLSSLWLAIRFSAKLGMKLSGDVAAGFFNRGISFLRSESPSVLASYTIREVDRAVTGGILQLCLIISKLFQIVLVVGLLVFVSPMFSAVFVVVATAMYTFFFSVLRDRMAKSGESILEATGRANQTATELYASGKEVIVRGNLDYFISNIRGWLLKCNKADEVSRVFPMVPKYLIELVAFSLLLSLPIYRSWSGGDYRSVVPFVALFAYAGYRLLPSLQQVYASLSILKFNTPAIEYLGHHLGVGGTQKVKPTRVTKLNHAIFLQGVGYNYPGADQTALSNLTFQISRGEKLAIVGLSGSGKTTLLDILLGLVVPSEGTILIDTMDCPKNEIAWSRNALGYAPQMPLILGASVAENIAFGVDRDAIDMQRCTLVAEFASVHEVILALPEGYDTRLGGDGSGVALSGGEYQRIAIARAMYHSPEIVVLDEPTSALDPTLSARLVARLCDPDFDKTVIMVTHDWDALPAFDKIVVIDGGRIIGMGPFDEVTTQVEELRKREAEKK